MTTATPARNSRHGSLTSTPSQNAAAPRVLLSSRSQIDRMGQGLNGVTGAQEIISCIVSRPHIAKLVLGGNKLSSSGAAALFTFLRSDEGRRYKIKEISLNSNCIGDEGLREIGEWLKGDRHCTGLILQNNNFTGSSRHLPAFTAAVNASSLRTLSLATNHLYDEFALTFFPSLSCSSLRELHVSTCGMTAASALAIAAYVSSPRCALSTLSCNGNSFGLRGVRTLVDAIERGNWSLSKVEVFANRAGADDDMDEDAVDEWPSVDVRLRRVLVRNEVQRKMVRNEALDLLVYARAVLLESSSVPPCPLRSLPPELKLHILSRLAPTLSSAQRIRIFTYAASLSTLPSAKPKLSLNPTKNVVGHGGGCLADPAAPPGSGNGCSAGRCMGAASLRCKREEERAAWLERVGCAAYEPEVLDR